MILGQFRYGLHLLGKPRASGDDPAYPAIKACVDG